MRKTCISFLLFLSMAAAFGQETCHIVSDRSHYTAGERLFCAVTALSGTGSSVSSLSGVAYVGLYSAEGLESGAKVELIDGHGGGEMMLPKTLPTGNYLLVAWTKAGGQCDQARVISVYNTGSNLRTGQVEIVSGIETGSLSVVTEESDRADIMFDESATVSVSLIRDCGLPEYLPIACGRIVAPGNAEPDGETISVRISGNENYEGLEAFLAVPGSDELYSAPIGRDGIVCFKSQNIHGHKDVAFVIGKDDQVGNYEISLEQPFAASLNLAVPPMLLSESLEDRIAELGNTGLDTLSDVFPTRKPAFLYGDKEIRFSYILDDYTRFPTMRETFIEFVSDIRARKEDGKTDIRVRFRDNSGANYLFDRKRSLTLLDGVPVFNQQLIYDYDPALVKRIDVYRGVYFMGNNFFRGIANFVTFEGTLPGFVFGSDVKILEFDGVSPVRSYGAGHETLYWNPLVRLEAGQPLQISLPEGAEGQFILNVEGFTDSGKAVHRRIILK